MSTLTMQFFLFLSVCSSFVLAQKGISVSDLKCESMVNPLSVESQTPRFSWILNSEERDTRQITYHIKVADTEAKLMSENSIIWDTKVVKSDCSIMIVYGGTKLQSEKKYFWKVRVSDNHGHLSEWSKVAWFQMGLLDTGDWSTAKWIGYENFNDSMKIVPGIHGFGDQLGTRGVMRTVIPQFRKEFTINKKLVGAYLYISGLGQYEATLNGIKVGQSFLSPGWTDYEKTCLYNVFDVSKQLLEGMNVLGVMVGNGFYNINRERYRKLVIAYGNPKMICKLKLIYQDGTTSEINSGKDWKCMASPIQFSSIYGGEDYNATLEQKGWEKSTFDDSSWRYAVLTTAPSGRLISEKDYPVKVNQIIKVQNISKIAPGRFLYDFGQNCSGIVNLRVKGKRGATIKITPGELITPEKEINQRASGSPYYYSYTMRGEEIEFWQPKFTYYGFRYAMVEGAIPDEGNEDGELPRILELQMLHTTNSSPKSGSFKSSNQLFNQIYSLIDWAIRSNIQSVVTDCPHREKLGWLEQTYLMGASLHYNYELYPLYRKVISDMIDAQTSDGLVPDIAPEYTEFLGGFRDSPEWGSAAVILPWMLWEWYGDREVLTQAMPMMEKYVNYLGTKATGNLLNHGLGDWFDYGPKSPGEAQLTPKTLTATAIYYYDLQLLGKMLKICNRNSDAAKIDSISREVKRAFNVKFFDSKNKVYSTGSQTAMAMPLCVGLVESEDRKMVFKNLMSSISAKGNELTAGDVGFHFLVKALEEEGGSQLLYDMNFRNDVPGYGFQLRKGATALTESWPALKEVSNNHLMLGHLMEWFYTGLGGIKQANGSIAFKNVVIRPEIVGDLTNVTTDYISSYGKITSAWTLKNGILEMLVSVPVNTEAEVFFPVNSKGQVSEGGKNIQLSVTPEKKYFCKIGSGFYKFIVKLAPGNQQSDN